MPIQAPQWTEFLSCPVCCNEFNSDLRGPVTLGCGHSICRGCLTNLHRKQCPFDQSLIRLDISKIPLNGALVSLVGGTVDEEVDELLLPRIHLPYYIWANRCIQDLALYLKPFSSGAVSLLSKPMQKKLVTLVNCQLLAEEGRARALRAARSLGERTVTELLLLHQNPQQLSANLWAAVRARGCQFLGPAMQEEVLKLVLLALEDGSALSRKVLVMFVVQRLEPHYSQASKTSIGHVVQLLYRASCFIVSKREFDSSLMQLKEEFRSYDALRREHDAQIVQIATEAGLRIAPDQWSALLYGDTAHKSHMQSIMDKLQTPQSFSQSVQELVMALQRSGDPGNLSHLRSSFELLANIDSSPDASPLSWEKTGSIFQAAKEVVSGLAEFISQHGNRRQQDSTHAQSRHKSNLCRDVTPRGQGGIRGGSYNYGHSELDPDKFRGRNRKIHCSEGKISRDSSMLPAILQVQHPPSMYESEMFHPARPANILVAVPNFNTLGNGMSTDPYWLATDKNVNAQQSRSQPLLGMRRSEIILVSGNQIPEREEYAPFTHLASNKFGPANRQFHGMTYDDSAQCMNDAMGNVNSGARWLGKCSRLLSPESEVNTHCASQSDQNIFTESQRVKQQLRKLEKKILDLKLGDMQEAHQSQLVDELRQIQEGLRDEEVYEAGIAEDMKELEQRWESELAELEKRWNETDATPLN